MGLTAFGLGLLIDVKPPGAWEARSAREPCLQIRCVTAGVIADVWSGAETTSWESVIDGAPFVVERGAKGDYRFVHGAPPGPGSVPSARTLAIHHLSSDAHLLQCAPMEPTEPSWWRVVLDSVLFTVALLRGYEALHAGAIAMPDGAIAVTAAAGGGKSTLLAELMARGLVLVADDVLVLEPHDAELSEPAISHPGPPLMTVPTANMALLGTAAPPDAIAVIGDESWLAVPAYPQPLPLKALIVLDRRPESQWPARQPSLSKIEHPLATLLNAMMSFPSTPERQRARFELASVVARTAGMWQLTARLDTPADALADVLLAGEL